MPQRAAAGDCFSKNISVGELDVEQLDVNVGWAASFRFDPKDRGEVVALPMIGWLALH